MNSTEEGFAYDAASILGFGTAVEHPLPRPPAGEIIIRYGGWSFGELMENLIRKDLMLPHDKWCEEYDWYNEKLDAGIYSLRIPVADSNNKSFSGQLQLLSKNEHVAPIILATSALACHYLSTFKDPLQKNFTRCKELDKHGYHIVLYFGGSRYLCAGQNDGKDFDPTVFLSSVRMLRS